VIVRTHSFLAAALLALPLAACVTHTEVVKPSGTAPTMVAINGSVNYTTGGQLPQGALVTVQALDGSRADAAATPISESRWSTGGEQVPLSFSLPIDQKWFTSGKRLTIRASITIGGKLAYATTTPYLTNGAIPPGPITIMVAPVR
jgi:putative lipoprotein